MDQLIKGFLRNELSVEELEKLKQWLQSGSSNRDHFKQAYMLWKVGSAREQDKTDVDLLYQKVYLEIVKTGDNFSPESGTIKPSLFTRILPLLKYAAAIILSLFVGGVFHNYFMKGSVDLHRANAFNEINVPLGSKTQLVLPDKSEVWLNAGSRLTYSMDFGQHNRELDLVGEAYFKVARKKSIPFIVHTARADIKAIGTEFNVKAYPDEDFTETILVKGIVVVDNIEPKKGNRKSEITKSFQLKPGQKAIIYNKPESLNQDNEPVTVNPVSVIPERIGIKKHEINIQATDIKVETSWKEDRWIIQGKNLNELANELNRRFNVAIILEDQELAQYKFSGIIQSETIEQVFDLIRLTIPMNYTIDKGKVRIALNRELREKYKRAYKK